MCDRLILKQYKYAGNKQTLTLLHVVVDGVLDGSDPGFAVIRRATHEFVHLGFDLALADEVDAFRVFRIAFLSHEELSERDHTRLVVRREEVKLAVVVDEKEHDVSEDDRKHV